MKKYELSIVIKEVDGQESKDIFREFSVTDNMHKVIYRVLTITNYLCEQVAAGLMLKYHKEAWGNTLPPSGTKERTATATATATKEGELP